MSSGLFNVDIRPSAMATVALINTAPERGGQETITDTADLVRIGRESEVYYRPDGSEAELRAMRLLRRQLDDIVSTADPAERMRKINAQFMAAGAMPQIVTHAEDERPHFHYTLEDAPYIDHMRGVTAYAIARLMIMGEFDRIRTCAAEDCRRVFFDVTRNGGRLYCDSRTCGNRTHAARFRDRHNEAITD